jgi:hypothetical protein
MVLRFISNCKWVSTQWHITMTIPHTNTQVTYTIHISHKITPLKQQSKQRKTNELTKLNKQWRTYYSQWIQHRKRKRNKAIPNTGLRGLLSHEMSRLSQWLKNRFIVGGQVAHRRRFTIQNDLTKYLLVLIYVRGWAILGIMLRLEGPDTLNYNQLPHGESNPRPSDL